MSPKQKTLPSYLNNGDYLYACDEILREGWPASDEEIGRWLDAMFAGAWAKSLEDAASRPLGLMVDPRTFHWVDVEKDGKRQMESSVKLPDFVSAGRLFAVRAMQLQNRGQERAALSCLQTSFGLSRQVIHCAPNSVGIRNSSTFIEGSALRAFNQCVVKIGPKATLLREALEMLQRHEKETPDPLDGIKADYLISRHYPTHLWGHWTDASPQHYLLKWALETPWEWERQTRFINAVYQGQLRVAGLTLQELEERRQKTAPRNVRLADVFGLTLTDSKWSAEQWAQLIGEVSMFFEWPWWRTMDSRSYYRDLHVRQVWLALMLYQIREGKAATSLEDLVPKYLASLPPDLQMNETYVYKVSQGEEIEGHFPAGKSPRQDRLLPGQGVLWRDAYSEHERIWYPVPVWPK